MNAFLKSVARWRTYLVNLLMVLVVLAPEVINSPEILALIPEHYQRWVLAAVFLINIWMRPRPAVLPTDPEAAISKARR